MRADPFTLAREIRARGARVGLALKPGTPVEPYLEFIAEFDQILVMTVEPGFGGQSFIESVMPKLARIRAELDRWKPDVWLQVDGGVTVDTIRIAAEHGADTFVAGTAVFHGAPAANIAALRAAGGAPRPLTRSSIASARPAACTRRTRRGCCEGRRRSRVARRAPGRGGAARARARLGGLRRRMRLRVGPGAFVPRARTLVLARAAAKEAAARGGAFVEAYAGVAPVASFVAARVPGVEVHAASGSPSRPPSRDRISQAPARFTLGDLLAALPARLHARVDVIAAVPPYIPESERHPRPTRRPRARVGARALRWVGWPGSGPCAARRTPREWLAPDGVLLLELNRRQAAALAREPTGWRVRYRTASDGQTALVRASRA